MAEERIPILEGDKKKKGKRISTFLLIVILSGLITSGAFVLFKKGGKLIDLKKKPTPAPTEAVTPSPIPVPVLNRGDLKVKVLNGSGITGLAGKAKKFLEELGYQEVATGNADSYDYEKTEIAIKEEKKDYFDFLVSDLKEEYSLKDEALSLDEEDSFDVVITLGKE